MSHSFETINDLLAVMDGSMTDFPLHEIQSDVTKDYALLTVFDWGGHALFQSGAEAEADPIWVESLKKTVLVHLQDKAIVQFRFPRNEHGVPLEVLGVRIDSVAILIAWASEEEKEETSAEAVKVPEKVVHLIDALVGQMHVILEENSRLATRIEHFRAEQKALWDAQSEAIKQALEERERRFQEKQNYAQQLQSVIHMAGDAIITLNEHGLIRSFNNEAVRMFGYESEETVGISIDQLLLQAPEPQVKGRFGKIFQKGQKHIQRPSSLRKLLQDYSTLLQGKRFEFQARQKQGTRCLVELTISQVEIDTQRLFTVILRDISARRETELLQQQLYRAQKLESIGQLAAGISHEINTPTQYIGDNITFLRDAFETIGTPLRQLVDLAIETKEPADPAKALDQIIKMIDVEDVKYLVDEIPLAIEQSREGIQRVAQIVRSMKEFSYPELGEKQKMNVNRALQNTLVVSRGEWKYVATTETDFQENLPLVPAFESECNQVFLNLVVNAAQAIREKYPDETEIRGLIEIQTRQVDNDVEIRISDNGPGIPPEIQDRVFDPFFTTKEVGQGTGQGLAIAHLVVAERHGGSLFFETEPGESTTFIVRLPLEPLK